MKVLPEPMTPEEAIQIADEVLLAHAGNSLTDIQRMILRESLAGNGYEDMTGYTTQHIKNEGKKLWDLLSEALQEKVSKTNFKGALGKRLKSSKFVPKLPTSSKYNSQTWVGRESLIIELLSKLQGQTRLLWVTGISGVGKTALAECLAARTQNPDVSFHRISFDVEGQTQDFTTGAEKILLELGEKELDSQERNDPKRLSDRLLHKLQTHPYWIQLDALERLFHADSATEFADAHWLAFLQRCLDSELPSRLVLTAQALPTALARFEDDYPQQWHSITLQGLDGEGEDSEQLELFIKNGLTRDTTNEKTLCRIGQIYEGHPLVLQVIAKEILAKPFKGDVASYWQRYSDEFEQVARELQTQRVNPALYSQRLQNQVRQRIEVSLKRLPADALDLLCRSAVYRRPVPETFWLAMIDDSLRDGEAERSPIQQTEAYRVLGDRALVEREGLHQGQFLIRQHNLIRSVAYDLLKANHTTWETAERRVAHLWLTNYKPAPNAPNLETVRGYLEAFDHHCEVEDWKVASDLFTKSLNDSPKSTLYWKLYIWSYYLEEISLCRRLLGKSTKDIDALCWNGIGNAYLSLGNYPEAKKAYEESLATARKIKNRRLEGNALGNLGITHNDLGTYQKAVDCHLERLQIALEINDRQGEGIAQGNLGIAYKNMGKYEDALICHQKRLEIARELDDDHGQGNALGNLGIVYYRLKNYEKAIEYHQKQLEVALKIDDRRQKGHALCNLGITYHRLERYLEAIKYHDQYLKVVREIRDFRGEGTALNNLSTTQVKLGQYRKGLENSQAALRILHEVGDQSAKAEALKNLAELHQAMGEVDVARRYCQQALAIATELGIPLAAECEALQLEIENEQLKVEDT